MGIEVCANRRGWLYFLVMLATSALVYEKDQELKAQKEQLAGVNAELDKIKSTMNPPSFDLQVRCADQARKEFVRNGNGGDPTASYESHFNTQFNRCFIDQSMATPGASGVFVSRSLYDAVEGRDFGSFQWVSSTTGTNDKLIQCYVMTPQGQRRNCKSQSEFNALAQTYMGK